MSLPLRPLVVALSLSLSLSAVAASKPAKPAKAEAAPPAKVEIELAHNLGGIGEDRLQEVIERFNRDSKLGTVKLVRRGQGDKPEALNLVRRFEVEDLMRVGGLVPLYKIMADAKEPFQAKAVSADLGAGVTDDKSRYVALPIAYSTPVLFYSKAAFRKAKLDPEQPPKTWQEMQNMLDKLQDAGYECPYTTAWPVWVHIDNVGSLSSAPATEKGSLQFNDLVHVKHVAMLTTWQKARFFKSYGRGAEANAKFADGTCATITTDSWAYTEFREANGLEFGVAPLPHHDEVYGGRQHTLADGASLWVGAGKKPAEYKLAAKFVSYLLSPDMQIAMARTYGQLPITDVARSALSSKILRDHDQSLSVAYASLRGKGAQPALRVANIDSVRIIADEELEAVWDNKKPAKLALDTAVQRGNAVLSAKPVLKKVQPF